ncbi:hypothetical protein N7491_005071 [Penicillium cf. griseofulvum]|uniref:Uncharacterized protein n=1 Tax=Penicillium cf. griseofulvum TaxID=2972120 RepID=A0A9W9J1R7_9EURO|nr:hypothetical protein N7472_007764 [Penicillium cf. griseofulvum]KAJ5434476.1 hypothetical protein N7491_005071 [Penicillium cf. griseofulvum]KAJ5452306.1 hypothetical protein N7445_000489 [Penicillium cf. griseofulvum]
MVLIDNLRSRKRNGPALLPGLPHGIYPRFLIFSPLHLLKGCLKPAPRRQSRLVLLSLPWRETGRSRFPTSTHLLGPETPILFSPNYLSVHNSDTISQYGPFYNSEPWSRSVLRLDIPFP